MKKNKELNVELRNKIALLSEISAARSSWIDLVYFFHTQLGNIGFHSDLYLKGRELSTEDYDEWKHKRAALEFFIRKYNESVFRQITPNYIFKPSIKSLVQFTDRTSFDTEEEYREETKKDIRVLNRELAELDDVLDLWEFEVKSHIVIKFDNIEFQLDTGKVSFGNYHTTLQTGSISYKLLESIITSGGKIEQSELYRNVYREKVDYYLKKHHAKLKSSISELRKKMDMYGMKAKNKNRILYIKPYVVLSK